MTRAALIAAYLAALLAVDTQVDLHGQLALGALTWIVLIVAAWPLATERRAQVAVVICAATVAELTGSILWGVYSYRLHNLPTFVPPAHGLVFMAGLASAKGCDVIRARWCSSRRSRVALGRARIDGAATPRRRRRARRPVAARFSLALAGARGLRRGLPRRGGTRALRDCDRNLAVGRKSSPGSAFPTAIRRAASPPATSGSTSWPCSFAPGLLAAGPADVAVAAPSRAWHGTGLRVGGRRTTCDRRLEDVSCGPSRSSWRLRIEAKSRFCTPPGG